MADRSKAHSPAEAQPTTVEPEGAVVELEPIRPGAAGQVWMGPPADDL
ncbi:MAG TPA: hypothetical protein VGJ26_05995 [Pirellulales bacterium]